MRIFLPNYDVVDATSHILEEHFHGTKLRTRRMETGMSSMPLALETENITERISGEGRKSMKEGEKGGGNLSRDIGHYKRYGGVSTPVV